MGFPLFKQPVVVKRHRRPPPSRMASAALFTVKRKFVLVQGQRQTIFSAYRNSDGKLDHEFVLLGWIFESAEVRL